MRVLVRVLRGFWFSRVQCFEQKRESPAWGLDFRVYSGLWAFMGLLRPRSSPNSTKTAATTEPALYDSSGFSAPRKAQSAFNF